MVGAGVSSKYLFDMWSVEMCTGGLRASSLAFSKATHSSDIGCHD